MASSIRQQSPAHLSPESRQPNATARGASILGRYRIMESCGTGGFGTVLTCWDTRLQRRVAIKRMPLSTRGEAPGMASTLAEGLAEARTSSMLAHPNIITVFDFERDDECAYLVMEYVEGITLSELLQRVEGGTLTPDECAYLVNSLGSALAYAHENGVLHLDIKPSNIMIDRTGKVKLCDFGMATLASATGFGDARGGTVGYMPPEQIEGLVVDERTDVFALGVVIWQALTGECPFAAATAEQSLKLIKRGPKMSISKMVPDASGMTEQALLGALEPNPALRTPSISDFANEVSFALGDTSRGSDSIRLLLSQTGEEDEVDDEAVAAELPLHFRYPWIEGAIQRVLAAALSGWLVYEVGSFVFNTGNTALIAALTCAVAAAAWPPLGSVAVFALIAFALVTTTSGVTSILLGGVFAFLVVTWWAISGWNSKHSTAAALLPLATRVPIASAAYAGAFLTPGNAFLTATIGWLASMLYQTALATGFDASMTAQALLELALMPSNWISAASCVFAATLAAAVTRARPGIAFSILGQVLGLALVCGGQLLAKRVENGGIWVAPTWDTVGIAVVLWVFACAVRILVGPAHENQEADVDELA